VEVRDSRPSEPHYKDNDAIDKETSGIAPTTQNASTKPGQMFIWKSDPVVDNYLTATKQISLPLPQFSLPN